MHIALLPASSLQTKDDNIQKSIESIQVPKLNYNRSTIRKNLEESPSFKQLPVYREDTRSKEILRSVVSRDNLSSCIQNISITGNQISTSIASVTKFSHGGKETLKENLNSRYYGYRRPIPEMPKTVNVNLKPEPQSPKAVETKRLVDHLKQQVVYDEELRNSKLNFAALQDPNKWAKLSDELKKRNIIFSEGQLKV
jgi:hypothetical protein